MSRHLTIDHLGALIDSDYGLTAYCYAQICGHSAKLDLEGLAQRLGREHSIMHKDLVPKLRCSECGGRNIGLRLSPPTGSPGHPAKGQKP